jgi:hypothetical protein
MRSCYLTAALLLGLVLGGMALSAAAEEPDAKQIAKLIDQLGSSDFNEREKATAALDAIGAPAWEALKKAAQSNDVEVRRRALDLLKKVERRVRSAQVVAPTRVHLVYKDTPVAEAVADFKKKSGYEIVLHDPENKLKDRNITLDTGETTFWHALDLFCQKAGLSESSAQHFAAPGVRAAPGAVAVPPAKPISCGSSEEAVEEEVVPAKTAVRKAPPPANAGGGLGPVPAPPPVGPVPGVMGGGMPQAAIILVDGKAPVLPTDDASAVRVRALAKTDQFGPAAEGEYRIPLEVSPEPKLQWQRTIALKIEKALDDQGQLLRKVEASDGPRGLPPGVGGLPGGGFAPMIAWGGLSYHLVANLKKGAKAARSLKELKGSVEAEVLTPVQPVITVENILKAAGKTIKGTDGGLIKVLEVTRGDEGTTVRFEMEQPQGVIAGPGPVMGRMPAMPLVPIKPGLPGAAPAPPLPVPPPPVPPPQGNKQGLVKDKEKQKLVKDKEAAAPLPPPAVLPAPALRPVQVQVMVQAQGGAFQVVGAGAMPTLANGLSLVDDKDRPLPVSARIHMRGTAQGVVVEYTLTCQPQKESGQPAKLIFSGRRNVTIEIPFVLKDVPLP